MMTRLLAVIVGAAVALAPLPASAAASVRAAGAGRVPGTPITPVMRIGGVSSPVATGGLLSSPHLSPAVSVLAPAPGTVFVAPLHGSRRRTRRAPSPPRPRRPQRPRAGARAGRRRRARRRDAWADPAPAAPVQACRRQLLAGPAVARR